METYPKCLCLTHNYPPPQQTSKQKQRLKTFYCTYHSTHHSSPNALFPHFYKVTAAINAVVLGNYH